MKFLLNMFTMLADGEAATGTGGTSSGSGGLFGNSSSIVFIVILAVMIVGMVLLTIIPNKRKQKEYQKMQDEIRPGTKIMTIGRMIGTVVRVYDNNTLEVDVGTPGAPVVITINREAVGINLDAQAAAQAAREVKHQPAADQSADSAIEGESGSVSELPEEKSELPEEKSSISDDDAI